MPRSRREASFPLFLWTGVLVTLLCLRASTLLANDGDQGDLRAGAATSNITPWLGLSINGGMTDRTARRIHDELHARALVLEDGSERLAIVIADSCMIPREVVDRARERVRKLAGLDPERMLIAATHSHSSPAATGVFQSEPDPEYRTFLARKIADAVVEAASRLEPARLGWAIGRLPEHVFNRRWKKKPGTIPEDPFGNRDDRVQMNPPAGSDDLVEPAGPTDPRVLVLAAERLDGSPLALVACYALHYVGGVPAGDVSADYFGAFAAEIERRLGGGSGARPFVAMLANGASGDINNIDFRSPRRRRAPYEQVRRVASDLADEVIRVHGTIEYRRDVPLAARQATLELGVRKPASREVEAAREILGGRGAGELRSRRGIYARETVLLADYPARVELLLQAMAIGDLAIAAIPCEVFVEIGLELAEKSPFDSTFVFELANGYNGYLPTVSHHELGGYETWRARSSYLEVEAAPKIVATLLPLLEEAKNATGGGDEGREERGKDTPKDRQKNGREVGPQGREPGAEP